MTVVPDPRPDPIWEPVLLYCASTPRYIKEVMSQFVLDTTNSKAFDDPALTVYEEVAVVRVIASVKAEKRVAGNQKESFIFNESGTSTTAQRR